MVNTGITILFMIYTLRFISMGNSKQRTKKILTSVKRYLETNNIEFILLSKVGVRFRNFIISTSLLTQLLKFSQQSKSYCYLLSK